MMEGFNEFRKLKGKYFLLEEDEDEMIQPTLEINKSVYDKLLDTTKILHELKYYERKVLEIQLNHKDFFEKIEIYNNYLKNKSSYERKVQLNIIYVDLNRIFINFLASFRIFLEHLDKRNLKRYSENSVEYQAFKSFTRSNYNKLFSYRFFYKLRNYAIHYGYPIFHVEYDVDYQANPNIEQNGLIKTYFDKDQLLRFDDIKKLNKTYNDLSLFNYKFPVEPLMLEIQQFFKLLLPTIISIQREYYRESSDLLIDYHQKSYGKQEVGFGFIELNEKRKSFIWQKTMIEIETATLAKRFT